MENEGRFFADDRGNVVNFYDGDEIVANLDRETPPDDHKSWDCCGGEIEEWAKANGYADEIAEALAYSADVQTESNEEASNG